MVKLQYNYSSLGGVGLKFKNIEELMDKLNNEYKVLLDVIDNVILVIDNEMKITFCEPERS